MLSFYRNMKINIGKKMEGSDGLFVRKSTQSIIFEKLHKKGREDPAPRN